MTGSSRTSQIELRPPNHISRNANITCGVLQGSVLGP